MHLSVPSVGRVIGETRNIEVHSDSVAVSGGPKDRDLWVMCLGNCWTNLCYWFVCLNQPLCS